MWEVYYPNLGWMCVDATEPQKGNWLRYVNWARSAKEQNLCPLEINRAIYYKTLKPIEPGEELLVWYNGVDNPEIAAAIEEERAASHRSKKSSPKSRRGRRRALHAKKKLNINKQEKKSGLDLTFATMKDSPDAPNEEDAKPLGSPVLSLEQTAVIQEMVNHNVLPDRISIPTTDLPKLTDSQTMEDILIEQEPLEDSQKESSERDSINQEEESAEMLDDLRSTSDETPEGSPKKKPIKIPKPKVDANGDLLESFMFPCQHCERKFTTKQGLERHMHIHVSSVNHAFKCRYCGKAFGTQINRRRHERRHESGPKRKSLMLSTSDEFGHAHKHIIDSLKATDEYSSSRLQSRMTDSDRETSHSVLSEENGESSRELHPCKYCKKVFGTHTNMRRHQRRVHERHLIPKGVRRKEHLLEDPQLKSEQSLPAENIYVASTEIEEDGEADDVYIMDISNNISENLTYFIDGKLPTCSASGTCDVIEVETNTSDVLGINCLLTPIKVEVSQNVRPLQTTPDNPNPLSDSSGSGIMEPKKRRTISPPLLSKIKTEVELEPVTPSCSLTIPLSVSVGESLPFPKEKSVYLSSKLKQLLQMQESNKSQISPSLLSEIPKLSPAVSTLTSNSNRFKRRTSSPPSSPQLSPAPKEYVKQEAKSTWSEGLGPKIPKLESQSSSPVWSLSGREERENLSPCEDLKINKDWTSNVSFGNTCNQQPLDLSSGVKQKCETKSRSQVSWESVLDLSVSRKPFCDTDTKEYKGNNIGVKKKKPTTCMLKKVLLNEYDGLEAPGESVSQTDTMLPCRTDELRPVDELDIGSSEEVSIAMEVASALDESKSTVVCQSPPILTPSEAPSPSQCSPFLTDVTLPPPLLTTDVPSLPDSSSSVPQTPSCASPLSASTQSPLPVLSRTVSPSPSLTTDDPSGCASPGPPTLSSSSPPSSSSSSSSSSCSSPPPLSVVSSVLSPSLNSDSSAPIFKQEKHDEGAPTEDSLQISPNDSVCESFTKSFMCNVCESPFVSIKDLAKHLVVHAEEWPFKCEFCVQLFKDVSHLSEHRSVLHGVGKIFVCSICKKEFAFLCNLQQHQQDMHADKEYSHRELESGTLRPQNFTDPNKASLIQNQRLDEDPMTPSPEDDGDLNDSSEELYTTIKILAAGEQSKDPDVRMGLNQHYPSFKPPPFQYHNKNPLALGATATNFTTHNIPQTFTTAIRCTKCGKSVDNMPELHKHILVCASASDKKRYTPKKNPIPLKQTVQPKNGVGVVVLEAAEKNSFRRMGQPKKLNFTIEIGKMSSGKLKLSAIKRKNQLVQKAILQKNKRARRCPDSEPHFCPYCNREFTYIKSLNKHASFSCPKKPASPPTKKLSPKPSKKASSVKKKKTSIPRRTADAEIQMQSTELNLGKTRARSLAPVSIPPPTPPMKSKQNVKSPPQVKSKKQAMPVVRNSSPVILPKGQMMHEGKKSKKATLQVLHQSFGRTHRKLHLQMQKSKLPNKLLAKKKKDKYSSKSRERLSGPRTRSSADYSDKKEDGRQESR
ncbi:histone-lysine N-methyltransferase activity [Pristimantis euphronides]